MIYQDRLQEFTPAVYCVRMSNITIPLVNGKSAIISPQDEELVKSASPVWRVSASGYPIYVQRNGRKATTIYMHKLIMNAPARHLNGDRLDNRRENLVLSNRNQTSTAESSLLVPSPFFGRYHYNSDDLKLVTGRCQVQYEGDRVYTGDVKFGIPHGYGELTSAEMKTVAIWDNGKIFHGVNIKLRTNLNHAEVEFMELIKNNEIIS